MAICITHTNTTDQTFPLQIIIKDGLKDVETVELGPNQEVWSEAHTLTSSLRVYQRKGLIIMKEHKGKTGVRFLVPYTIGEKQARNPQPALPTTSPKPAPKPAPAPEPKKETPPTPKPVEQKLAETSIASILDKASKQVEEYTTPELKTGTWEDDELTYLKRYYPTKGAKFVSEKLNRGEKSVSKKAEALKIKRKRK